MPAYFFRSAPGAAELRRLARRESGRVCQRVLMIANLLEGMEHEEAARLAGLSRSAAYEPKSGSWMIARWPRIGGNYRDGDRNDETGGSPGG